MSPDDGLERLLLAVGSLAASAAPIQQRLADAALALVVLPEADFNEPEDRERFAEIIRALTAQEDAGAQGTIAATVGAMSDEEAVRVAQLVVDLHHSVCWAHALRGE